MDCTDFIDRYSDYDDSLLPPREEAVFRAHLDLCEACARYDRVLRKGRMLARQMDPEPTADFIPRLRLRLLTAPEPRLMAASPVAAGGFLTLALAAVLGLWLVDAGPGSRATAELQIGSRATSLPASAYLGPVDWTTGRVDRGRASSYSPLEIGPPAYRASRSVSTGLSSTISHTLD
ncbi:MAG: zf-HC2 domain-containing protein [Gemmatimonadetes bacterium]|nr:zf-HC2 domain-containing protein [Gemmatimonadota bacterium]